MNENNWKVVRNNKQYYNNIFINVKSNNYKELKINPDLETSHVSDKMQLKNNFKYFINNKYFENFEKCEITNIIDYLKDKSIIDEKIYKLYYKKELFTDFSKIYFKNNIIYYYKINNLKKINIIIYNFGNMYGVLSYYNINKIRLLLIGNYFELLLYLYKLELDMKIIPKFSKIVNYPKIFINLLNHNDLKAYFNTFTLYWK